MHVEILTSQGCPHTEATRDLVHEAVRLEAVEAVIDDIEVNSAEVAQQMRFLGSPSVRIDGEDVEHAANERSAYGVMCRTYRDASGAPGVPPIELIRNAIRRCAVTRT
jgi:glutaredoxin